MRKCLSSIVLALALVPDVAFAQAPQPDPPAIVAQGLATLKRAPDRAWVSVAVESREGKAADARRQAATQMTTVQNAVKMAGIPADAIKTTDFSLQTQTEWDGTRSRISGYVVRNEIEVRVDSIDKVSDVIDATASLRTSNTLTVTISNVRFDLKNAAAVEQETLGMAVKDAMARAQAISAAAGRSLGPILRVVDQRQPESPERPIMFAQRAAVAAQGQSTPITPNEIEIRSSVSVTVGIR
jgi:uncharacterized protein